MFFNMFFEKKKLPEGGHNRWPKHVGSYDVYSVINSHKFICSFWLIPIISTAFIL